MSFFLEYFKWECSGLKLKSTVYLKDYTLKTAGLKTTQFGLFW